MTTISREQKLFGLEEARSTLPLVSRIVRDIVEKTERMKEVYLKIRQEAEDDADIDACKVEHLVSAEACTRLVGFLEFLFSNDPCATKFLETFREALPALMKPEEK